MREKMTFSEWIGSSIFYGLLFSYVITFIIVSLQGVVSYESYFNRMSIVDILISPVLNIIFPVIFIGFVIYDVYFNFITEKTNIGQNYTDKDLVTKKADGTIVINGIEKRIKELPKKLGFFQTDLNNEKIFDKLDGSINNKDGIAIFKNNYNVINFDNYLKPDNVTKIRNYLGIPNNEYLELAIYSTNKVIMRFKEPFGNISFKHSDLKKGQFLIGYTIKKEPYYIDLQKLSHFAAIGATGSGKSVSINGVLVSVFYNIEYFEAIYLCDLKGGMELFKYDGIFNGKVKVYTSISEFIDLIFKLHTIMEDREAEAKKYGLTFSPQKPIFVLVDEFGQLQETLEGSARYAEYEDKKLFNTAVEYLNKIMTKSRALKIFLWFYSQKGTIEHYPTTVREMCLTKQVMKTSGFYNAFIDDEVFKREGKNPDFFSIGQFFYKDGTESFGKTGDQYVFMKAVFTRQTDVIDILPEEDLIISMSRMYAQKIMLEVREWIHNNKHTEDEYELLTNFFKERGTGKVDIELVNEKLIQWDIDTKYNDLNNSSSGNDNRDTSNDNDTVTDDNFDKEMYDNYMNLYNEFLEYSEKVKHLLNPVILENIDKFKQYVSNRKEFNENDLIKLKEHYSNFKSKYKLDDEIIDVAVEINEEVKVETKPKKSELSTIKQKVKRILDNQLKKFPDDINLMEMKQMYMSSETIEHFEELLGELEEFVEEQKEKLRAFKRKPTLDQIDTVVEMEDPDISKEKDMLKDRYDKYREISKTIEDKDIKKKVISLLDKLKFTINGVNNILINRYKLDEIEEILKAIQ